MKHPIGTVAHWGLVEDPPLLVVVTGHTEDGHRITYQCPWFTVIGENQWLETSTSLTLIPIEDDLSSYGPHFNNYPDMIARIKNGKAEATDRGSPRS